MPTTNFFFNNFSSASEQRLFADLTTEMIKMYGVETYYMPRTHVAIDQLFDADALSKFDHAIPFEMYIKNFSGYEGEGDMLSKFGITMADQITFCISRTRFAEDIGSQYDLIRPLEGDLIYLGMTSALFEIKFVEHESVFYQTGSLQFYELKCERFNYNSETMDTGIADIDSISNTYSEAGNTLSTISGITLETQEGEPITLTTSTDPAAQNDFFVNSASTFVDFSVTNPFGDVI